MLDLNRPSHSVPVLDLVLLNVWTYCWPRCFITTDAAPAMSGVMSRWTWFVINTYA